MWYNFNAPNIQQDLRIASLFEKLFLKIFTFIIKLIYNDLQIEHSIFMKKTKNVIVLDVLIFRKEWVAVSERLPFRNA